ncbi:MAG TPA: GYD domain-containing protein [Dehalococcoidia bacterium]|nr:GYD domain-containing protein [Dehalococcoidia bacterium]
MPYYLVQGSYTPEAVNALTRNPEDRAEAARGLVEKMGGRMLEFFYAQGEYDIVGIVEFPDAETANAFMMVVIKTGHLKATKTTPLFTVEETMRAMRRAGDMTYHAPGD